MSAGPYSIGSGLWPGLAKAAEEAGELQQVIGKIIAAGGEVKHWGGSDLRTRLEEEIADVQAALDFLEVTNQLGSARIADRAASKFAMFRRWHIEGTDKSDDRESDQ